MRAMIVLGISTLALVGCDGGDRTAATPATLPVPKAGLWRESVARDGHPLGLIGEMRACLDADARSRLSALGGRAGRGMCQSRAVTRDEDGAYHFSSSCQMGPGGRVATQGVLTGDLAKAYRVHAESDTRGAVVEALNGRHVIDLEADFLGPCPPDMAVGDVVIANGMKLNMRKLGEAASVLGVGG